jgi:hypothetical protein
MVRSRIAVWSLASAVVAAAGIAGQARAEVIVGTTLQNFLITWDSSNPANIMSGVAMQGLMPNEVIVGLDNRPNNNQVYAVGSFGRLYTMNVTTGQATQVGAGSFSPALNGSQFGTDWNPVSDQMRVVSNAHQNLVISPTGAVTAQSNVAAQAGDEGANDSPNVVHLAYTNNTNGATTTQLFGIDTGRDRLVNFANPANGQYTTVGALGFDATELGGFDVSGATGTAFAAFTNAAQSRTTFGSVNLTSGAFTPIGEVGGGNFLTAMTIVGVVPAPASLALLGLGMVALRRRSR